MTPKIIVEISDFSNLLGVGDRQLHRRSWRHAATQRHMVRRPKLAPAGHPASTEDQGSPLGNVRVAANPVENFSTIHQTVWRPAQKNSWGCITSPPLTGRGLTSTLIDAASRCIPTTSQSFVSSRISPGLHQIYVKQCANATVYLRSPEIV